MGYCMLSIILGMGGVCVLLSVGILSKLLVYCFINGVVLFNDKFVHIYPVCWQGICGTFRSCSEIFLF
jgi:hypothetical protein